LAVPPLASLWPYDYPISTKLLWCMKVRIFYLLIHPSLIFILWSLYF
jgi:hypothetical protein